MKKQKKNLQKELEKKEKELEEHTNTLQRLQADFENYIKRVEKEKEEFCKYTNHELILKLLNIVDDLERFDRVVKNEKVSDEMKKGAEIILKTFAKLLNEEGVKEIKAKGEKLDPMKHEVMDVKESEKEVVLEELQKGYEMYGKVLRPAKVRIGKNVHKE